MRHPFFAEKYPESAGLIPLFLDLNNPAPAQQQIHEGYAHGGGWQPFEGFATNISFENPTECFLIYPGDPAMRAKAWCMFGEELVVVFTYDWVAIVQPDGSHTIARLD